MSLFPSAIRKAAKAEANRPVDQYNPGTTAQAPPGQMMNSTSVGMPPPNPVNPENGNQRDGSWNQQRRAQEGTWPLLRPRDGVQSPNEGHIIPPQNTQPVPDPSAPSPIAPVRVGQQRSQQGLGTVGTHRAGAAQQTVQDDQLMSYQLNSLLERGGQYLDRARQQGVDRAEQRGLGNSSIAGGNAVGAAIDRAMPIAAFDAGRYGEVGNLNQQATNVMANANADRALRGRMFDQEFRLNNRALDSQNYNNQFNSFMNNVSAIYNNPNMSAEDQTAAVENLRQMYPGFANDAWQQMPPGILSPGAVGSAQMMPPMQPMFQSPGSPSTPPSAPGGTGQGPDDFRFFGIRPEDFRPTQP